MSDRRRSYSEIFREQKGLPTHKAVQSSLQETDALRHGLFYLNEMKLDLLFSYHDVEVVGALM